MKHFRHLLGLVLPGAIVAGVLGLFFNPLAAVSFGILAMQLVGYVRSTVWWRSRRANRLARGANRVIVVTPDQVDSLDPVLRAAVAECWNTGKMVTAEVKEDGSAELTVHDD